MNALGRLTSLDRPTMSRSLKILVKAGLVMDIEDQG